jgi:titin
MFAGKNLSFDLKSGGKWCLFLLLVLWLGVSSGFGATLIVTNTLDSGAGSLRQAILDANTNAGPNTISFNIPSPKPVTIFVTNALPSIINPTLIDGSTEPGFGGTPVIELNGTNAGGNVTGLQLSANFCTVRALTINNFSMQGVVLTGVSNVICGNYIGTDTTGALSRGNGSFGIWVKSAGNLIGGTNVISGGGNAGVYIYNTSGNTVEGNLIGVTAAGTGALPNQTNGIVIDGSSGNVIGGTNAAMRNVISGNNGSGVYLTSATGNLIQGNYIGVNVSGSLAMSNSADGVTIFNGASGNTVGGTNAAMCNVISGNGGNGVYLFGAAATTNVILGNYIGTDASGKTNLANHWGVTISAAIGNAIGGTNAGAGNVISGNSRQGILLTAGAAGNCIAGNLIGLSAAGTNAVRNISDGITLSGAVSNTIGGFTAAACNVISGNASNGVDILQLGDSANMVCGNYIGTDVTGRKAIANALSGVLVQGCSNEIGGAVTGSGNVISGNGMLGVWLVGINGNVTGNFVQGNLLGLDATGTNSLGNITAGVGISSSAGNLIGGNLTGERNVISGNNGYGIFLIGTGTSGNQLQGNYIGTDSSGTLARGNLYDGINLQNVSTNQIGGSVVGAGNLISANGYTTPPYTGIYLENASWNMIQGNFIGTKVDGTNGLGNAASAINLDVGATNNIVGGTTSGAGNRVAYAPSSGPYSGVRVRVGSMNNLISGNSIFQNASLGIYLGPFIGNMPAGNMDCESGVAANAANVGQNYPVLLNAYTSVLATEISGTLDSGEGKTYMLQFFASPPSANYAEGQVFLGQTNLTLGMVSCSSNFVVSLPVSVPAGWAVTATATDPNNNTSEFSAGIVAIQVPSLQVVFTSTGGNQIGQISFSWTNNGGNFLLQQTFNLNPPVQWITLTNLPVLSNNFQVVTLNSTNASAFYRLTSP